MTTTKRRSNDTAAFVTCALVVLALSLLMPADVSAQWTTPDASQNITNTNTGNVGVGTKTPTFKFHVVGDINATGALCLAGDCRSTWAQVTGTNQWANGIGSSIYYLGGNVGVGTNNANQKLGVQGMLGLYPEAFVSPTQRGLFMFHGGDAGRIFSFNYLGGTADPISISASNLDFNTYIGFTPNTRLSIANGGNVGIGTTTPTRKLELFGDAAGLSFEAGTGSPNSGAIRFGDNTGWKLHFGRSRDSAGGALNSGTSGVLMTIQDNGNVGIGTTSPTSPLFIAGNEPSNDYATVRVKPTVTHGGIVIDSANNTSQVHLRFYKSGVPKWQFRVPFQDGVEDFRLYSWGANADVLDITPAGNVGIGTTAPTAKLDVVGQIRSSTGGFKFPDGTVQTTAATGSGSSGWTDGGSNVSLTNSSANVGIGITAPAYKLDVNGGFFHTTHNVQSYPVSSSGLAVGWNRTGGAAEINLYNVYDNAATSFQFSQKTGANTAVDLLTMKGSGNVGIGTSSPSSKLQIATGSAQSLDGILLTSSDGHFALNAPSLGQGSYNGITQAGDMGIIYSNGSQGTGAFVIAPWANAASGLRINANGDVGIGTAAPSAKLHVAGSLTVDGTFNAKYQDVAEWVESSQSLPAGTVVVLDHTKSNQVVASTEAYDTRVAGVVSAQPGITLGVSGATKVLVATTGRVRMKVDATSAPIQVGDLLVTGDREGFAMKSEPIKVGGRMMHMPGTLVGKALEPLATGTGEILVLLSLQ